MEVIMVEIKQYLTHVNYKKGLLKKNKYIVLHYTANNGDTALNNCIYFNKAYRGASANYFVDESEIYQCVKDGDIAWHVGAHKYFNECRNTNSIGIEMCSRTDENGKYYIKDETVENAIELTIELMKKYNIGIDHVVRHYDVTHKLCPKPWVEDETEWIYFKSEVERRLKMNEQYGYEVYDTIDKVPEWGRASVQKAIDAGILKGNGRSLLLTLTEVKVLCWLDRCKCFDFIE